MFIQHSTIGKMFVFMDENIEYLCLAGSISNIFQWDQKVLVRFFHNETHRKNYN